MSKSNKATGSLIGSLWRGTGKTLDDHFYNRRREQVDLIDENTTNPDFTADYKYDVAANAKEEAEAKNTYDKAYEAYEDSIQERRMERARVNTELANDAREVFKKYPSVLQGRRHGMLLYDRKNEERLKKIEKRRHIRAMKRRNRKIMRAQIRSKKQGSFFGHGLFLYDPKGKNDCSKLWIQEVYINGNGEIYDILLRCGTEQLHATPSQLSQWQNEGYQLMNPEKLY